ncbi:MAG: hypothetical protein ACYTET_07745 [Planctomycetota bacterium]|jgi:hypothetical protein
MMKNGLIVALVLMAILLTGCPDPKVRDQHLITVGGLLRLCGQCY